MKWTLLLDKKSVIIFVSKTVLQLVPYLGEGKRDAPTQHVQCTCTPVEHEVMTSSPI